MRSSYVDYQASDVLRDLRRMPAGKKPLLITSTEVRRYASLSAELVWPTSPARQIIFYDQIGCGKSNIPRKTATSTATICGSTSSARCAMRSGPADFHLFGNSWGGMLAMMCACKDDARDPLMVINGRSISQPGFPKRIA